MRAPQCDDRRVVPRPSEGQTQLIAIFQVFSNWRGDPRTPSRLAGLALAQHGDTSWAVIFCVCKRQADASWPPVR